MATLRVKTDVHQWMQENFGYLRSSLYAIKSLNVDDYNCIAWAAGYTDQPWWPSKNPDDRSFWPPECERALRVDAFICAFNTLGYQRCEFDSSLESDVEKVVIYVDTVKGEDLPCHMARQLETGMWTSKLGRAWDIEHELVNGVECPDYGRARYMMKRPRGMTPR